MTSLLETFAAGLQALQSHPRGKFCIEQRTTEPASYAPHPSGNVRYTVEFIEDTPSSVGKRPLEGADEPAKKKRVRRPKTKMVDMVATLENYAARIKQIPIEDFIVFNGAYLTDYKVQNTSPEDEPARTHIYVLESIAKSKGLKPLGVVSANRKDGKYLQALPNGELRPDEGGNAKVVYVGEANQFTKQVASKWALLRADRVMVDVPTTPQ